MSILAGECLCCGCTAAAHHLTGWSDTGCTVHRWCRHFSPMPEAPRRSFPDVLRLLGKVFTRG